MQICQRKEQTNEDSSKRAAETVPQNNTQSGPIFILFRQVNQMQQIPFNPLQLSFLLSVAEIILASLNDLAESNVGSMKPVQKCEMILSHLEVMENLHRSNLEEPGR